MLLRFSLLEKTEAKFFLVIFRVEIVNVWLKICCKSKVILRLISMPWPILLILPKLTFSCRYNKAGVVTTD